MADITLQCDRCGMSTGHTHVIRKLYVCAICGAEKRYPKAARPGLPIVKLIGLLENGATVKKAAQALKVTPAAVYVRLKKEGIELPPKGKKKKGVEIKAATYTRKQRPLTTGKRHLAKHLAIEMMELAEAGTPAAELAERYDLSLNAVYVRMRAAGIKPSAKRGRKT